MKTISPQYITDKKGEKISVILPIKDYFITGLKAVSHEIMLPLQENTGRNRYQHIIWTGK